MPTTDYQKLLDELLNKRKARRQFYRDPIGFMRRANLSQADEATLFTMKRSEIKKKASAAQKTVISNYQFSGHWDEQGQDWPAPTGPWTPALHVAGGRASDSPSDVDLLTAGGEAGSAWGDPGPHGRGFKPTSASVGETFTLTLVGEGLLDKATVRFNHVDAWRQPTGTTSFGVDSCHYANFRRCYLKCEVTIDATWPTGQYSITVENDPQNSNTFVKAGHFFRVTT